MYWESLICKSFRKNLLVLLLLYIRYMYTEHPNLYWIGKHTHFSIIICCSLDAQNIGSQSMMVILGPDELTEEDIVENMKTL